MRFSLSSAGIGVIGFGVILTLAGWTAIQGGYVPIAADVPPSAMERRLAMTDVDRYAHRVAPTGQPPIAATDANLTAGAHLYMANCSVCHGAADGRKTTIAAGLYEVPPIFAKHGVDDDPAGDTFWKIQHGIKLTGMPAFGATLSESDSWKITLFVKNLPALPPHALAAWKSMKVPGQLIAAKADHNMGSDMDSDGQ